VESFFAQGTSQTNLLVENNYFIGGGPLKFDCTTNPGCINQNITVQGNTFQGATLLLENACNVNGSCTGATINNNTITSNSGLSSCIPVNYGLSGSSGSGWTVGGISVANCSSSPVTAPATTKSGLSGTSGSTTSSSPAASTKGH